MMQMNLIAGMIVVFAGCSIIVALATLNVFFDYPDYFIFLALITIPIMFILFTVAIFFPDNIISVIFEKWED